MSKPRQASKGSDAPRSIVNRRARFDYEFVETYEAGMMLVGAEVKSVWLGRVNLTDAYCKFVGEELYVMNLDIEPYAFATNFQPERRRDRKLLLKRKELALIERRSIEKGLALIPARIYFNDRGKVKLEVALARGKKEYDKRKQVAEKDTRREMERARSERH